MITLEKAQRKAQFYSDKCFRLGHIASPLDMERLSYYRTIILTRKLKPKHRS